jgi:general secretion pathway protein J
MVRKSCLSKTMSNRHKIILINKLGFTLLEVLVVLVLVALVSTTILQGFYFSTNVQSRIKKQLIETQQGALQENWFREVARNYQPNFTDKAKGFSGSATEIKGVTLTALYGQTGIPTETRWILRKKESGSELYYQTAALPETLITSWPYPKVSFTFVDSSGQQYNVWPPTDEAAPLPTGIILSTPASEPGFAWYARISNNEKMDMNSIFNQLW